jgi:Holliday junction resolvasome RuvABC endonuclease subunit
MSTIVGIDLSLTATGMAVPLEDRWHLSTISPPPKSYGMERLDYLARKISGSSIGASLIVCEDIAFSRNMAGHSEVVMLHGLLRHGWWFDKIPLVLVSATSLKKFVCGHGGSSKNPVKKEHVMMSVLDRWGLRPADSNQADAIVLAQIGRCLLGEMQPEIKAQVEVLSSVGKTNAPTLSSIKLIAQQERAS